MLSPDSTHDRPSRSSRKAWLRWLPLIALAWVLLWGPMVVWLFAPAPPYGIPSDPQFIESTLDFDREWVGFMIELFGCPPPDSKGYIDLETCRPPMGSLNIKRWNRVRDRAKRLFDLEEKRK